MKHMLPVPQELASALKKCTHAVIIGHKHPDSDSLNSQLALSDLLRKLGKQTLLASAGPFTRHEILSYEPLFSTHIPEDFKAAAPLVCIVDCSSPDRIGYLSEEIEGLKVAVIDHHSSGSDFGDLTFINPKAFSVTTMILQLYGHFSVELDEENAHRILFGLATDTGYFRHIGAYRGEVFTMIAGLVEAGASPRTIYQEMYGQQTLESRRLLGLLLSRVQSYCDGRLLVTWETSEETAEYGEINRDSETLYAQMLSIHDAEVILYIREQDRKDTCIAGFRAHGDSSIDVGAAAAQFGGGGHRKASGATIGSSLAETKELLIQHFTRILI